MSGKSKRVPGMLVRCSQCGVEKPWQAGSFKTEAGKTRQPCVVCDTARRSRDRLANALRERANATQRMARWRENHPDKVKEANARPRTFDRALAKTRISKWKRAHPEVGRRGYRLRQARRLQLPNMFTQADWQACLTHWEYRCCVCGRSSDGKFAIAREHWVPLVDPRPDNPGTVPWNILPICHARKGGSGGCNNAKWTKEPVQWLGDYLGKEQAEVVHARIRNYLVSVCPTPPVMALLFQRCVATLAG